MRKYIAGNIIEDNIIFTADDNVTLVDPTAITVQYKVTYANVAYGPYTLTYTSLSAPAPNSIWRLSTGNYKVWMDTTLLPGYWSFQWKGQGTGQAVLPLSALVNPAPL